jgi:hypothetical protein
VAAGAARARGGETSESLGRAEGADVMADLDVIRAQMTRLLVLRNAPDDLDEWERALCDIPTEVLEAAATHALKTRVFFPLPAEVRADADAAAFYLRSPELAPPERERAIPEPFDITIPVPGQEPVTLHIVREWRYDCPSCRDTGWAEFWCGPRGAEPAPGQSPFAPVAPCDRAREHGPHAYVRGCPCVDTNPTIQRRLARQQRRFAEEPEEAGRHHW